MQRLWVLALLCVASTARADGEFALDFVHWNNTPLANAEQTRVAKAYLSGIAQIEPQYARAKVAQVICAELVQDLLATQHFYYCHLVFEANAVDGGPFDEGSVMAWDGKASAFHETQLDSRDSQGRIAGLRLVSAASFVQMKGMRISEMTLADPVGEAVTKAINAALAARFATAKGDALAAATKFFCRAHYDTNYLVERPLLRTLADFKAAHPGDEVEADSYARATASPHKIFEYARKLRSEVVAVRVDPTPRGFAMDEVSLVTHFTHPR